VFKIVSITLFLSLLGVASTYAEVTDIDSLHTQSLKGVTVNGQTLTILRSSLPMQEFSETEIKQLNATSVSDIA